MFSSILVLSLATGDLVTMFQLVVTISSFSTISFFLSLAVGSLDFSNTVPSLLSFIIRGGNAPAIYYFGKTTTNPLRVLVTLIIQMSFQALISKSSLPDHPAPGAAHRHPFSCMGRVVLRKIGTSPRCRTLASGLRTRSWSCCL